MIEALRDWTDELGEPPRSYEWSPGTARTAGLETARVRRWEREHPRWPSATTVNNYFGPWWSDALDAAGLPVRWRPGWSVPLPERVEAARRMSAEGHSAAAVADILGVTATTVRAYLRASACHGCGGPVVKPGHTGLCVECVGQMHKPHFTRDEILAAFVRWTQETGEPPQREDWAPTDDSSRKWAHEHPRWPSYMTVRTVFGSWTSGLEAAGYPPLRREWGPEDTQAALRRFAQERGRSPTQEDLTQPPADMPAVHHLTYKWGSFNRALEAAGLVPGRRFWSRDAILDAIRAFAERHGRAPLSTDWMHSTAEHPWYGTITEQFGSWPAALEAAGFVPSKIAWTRESMLEAIRRFADEHGRAPKSTEWKRRDPGGRWPGSSQILARFGSWSSAMEAAGLRAERTRWSPEKILAAMQRYADEHGRLPSHEDWNTKGPGSPWPAPGTVQLHFGSWSSAIEHARGVWEPGPDAAALRARSPRGPRRPRRGQGPAARTSPVAATGGEGSGPGTDDRPPAASHDPPTMSTRPTTVPSVTGSPSSSAP